MGGPICNQEIEIAKCICIAELACSIYDTTKSIRFRENIRCFGPHLVPISAAGGPHLVPISL